MINMNKYKIIFTDIDDTLNPKNKEVSEYTKNVCQKIIESGTLIVVNSGRSISYCLKKSKEANLSRYIIGSNGAEVYDYQTKQAIFTQPIPNDLIIEISKYCEETNTTLILNSLEKRFCNNKEYNYNDEPVIYYEDIHSVLKENQINQLVILSHNFDRMLLLPNLFKEKYPTLKIVHSSKALSEQKRITGKEYYHDIVLENTSKSRGIVELLDYLNINSEEAISIGDGYDDIGSTDVVGTSIAMGNANTLLKESSTYITDTALNDGAAKMLEKLCLNENNQVAK